MPPKAKIPAPIDRPLSRAYLREFTGWSTAFPPGVSEPTSLRLMENVMINRDGSLRIRPGLRYLSYDAPGSAIDRPVVGSHEAFFLNDGSKAYLFAVRETDNKVGFRVLKFTGSDATVLPLTDASVGFTVPQGESVLNFTSATTYVKYLQIDNKIIALSNAGETMRLFYVGDTKTARKLSSITEPGWTVSDKLTVVHPDDDWIKGGVSNTRVNRLLNPSAEGTTSYWGSYSNCTLSSTSTHARTGTRSWTMTATADGDMVMISDSVAVDSLTTDPYAASAYVEIAVAGREVEAGIRWQRYSSSEVTGESWGSAIVGAVGDRVRPWVTATKPTSNTNWARLMIRVKGVLAAEEAWVDDALLEKSAELGEYFDGDTADEVNIDYTWVSGSGPYSQSQAVYTAPPSTIPSQAVPYPNSLVSSNVADNVYNYGFFYTFNNEVGESAASQVTQIKAKRAWTGWSWKTPTANNEPSTTDAVDPNLATDQLVAYMPQEVFTNAMAQGATAWNLYMITWSDQEAVPIEGQLIATKTLTTSSTRSADGWLRVNPQNILQASDSAPLPSEGSRFNSTAPSSAAQGLVAADRMVLVNDKLAAGVIKWTANRMGEYVNFSTAKGGGYKTLTSGNLYVPACVKLWQNPQSVDTLTVLCLGVDGYSTSYYMAPGQATSQTDVVTFMGFEETTATPGTTSPYGCEVLNNALYHPTETELMKSTASNYNINHKTMTELIANMWGSLLNRDKIVSSQLDNRLYYLVHNRHGTALESGCWGNEVWVCDTGKEGGSWSRWRVQGQSLRKVEVDGRVVMSIVRPDGIFYFDDQAGNDEVVVGGAILEQAIAWKIETNTQGANRAHDAWAHLQQVSLVLGSFQGKVRWGVRGYDLHGKQVDVSKETTDTAGVPADGLPFDIEDVLLVRRDMKEWRFYAESLPGESSAGQINLVQYRYTPVSVNVGYEHGSIETFEYGNRLGAGSMTNDGVPIPMMDRGRP